MVKNIAVSVLQKTAANIDQMALSDTIEHVTDGAGACPRQGERKKEKGESNLNQTYYG